MNLFFSPQRATSGARIFAVQAGSATVPVEPVVPVALVADPLLAGAATLTTGSISEALVLIDMPAPRARCIFMDHQNRAIRL